MRGWRGVSAAVVTGLVLAGPAVPAPPACRPTPPDAEGPFYAPYAPARDRSGRGFVVSGVVRSAAGCAAVAGARLEWWSADPRGGYDAGHGRRSGRTTPGATATRPTSPAATPAGRPTSTSG